MELSICFTVYNQIDILEERLNEVIKPNIETLKL